ncbi:MAG: hypothetical protein P4L80_12165 [Xanthobacteraceae bacterium]|nr:hypothetical protein [Xanthobacteraceae bacterium]
MSIRISEAHPAGNWRDAMWRALDFVGTLAALMTLLAAIALIALAMTPRRAHADEATIPGTRITTHDFVSHKPAWVAYVAIGCPALDDLVRFSTLLNDGDRPAAVAYAIEHDCDALSIGEQVSLEDIGSGETYCVRPRGKPDCLWASGRLLSSTRIERR